MKTFQNLITLIGVLVLLACGSRTADAREYVTIKLPFDPTNPDRLPADFLGAPHMCTQGNKDTPTHQVGTIDEFALDFDVPG